MSSIAAVLGRLIERYYARAVDNQRDCRIVVPGLTSLIAEQVHEYLLGRGITAYLVVGDDVLPSEERMRIRPIGLTSKRIGSFVAIAYPGQLSQLQDSVRGSGGTIRSVLFSEEWPWVDNASEAFRFAGPVLDELTAEWTSNSGERVWLKQFVVDVLLSSTQGSSSRKQLLLEQILGSFSPDSHTEIPDMRRRFLFHSGIPCPSGPIPMVSDLAIATSRLCSDIIDRCVEEADIRRQTIALIPDFCPQDQSLATDAINALIDGIGRNNNANLGILSFHNCWDDNPLYWTLLTTELLEQLFQVSQARTTSLEYSVNCQRGVVSPNQKLIATFLGETIHIENHYRIPLEEFSRHNWEIRVMQRQTPLAREQLSSAEGTLTINLVTSLLGQRSYKKGIPIRVCAYADEELRAYSRMTVHLCGPERPAFVLLEQTYSVIDPHTPDDDEVFDVKVDTDEPTNLLLFSCQAEPYCEDDSEARVTLVDSGHDGVWITRDKVDPASSPTGQVSYRCVFGDTHAVICLEARDHIQGEFALEDELRAHIVGKNEMRLVELIRIFQGESREPYRHLGHLDQVTRRRVRLAQSMSGDDGWKVQLINLAAGDFDTCVGRQWVSSRSGVDSTGFANLDLPLEAKALVQKYRQARAALIGRVGATLTSPETPLEHPLYSTHPIYTASTKEAMEELLTCYLDAYIEILRYLKGNRPSLTWSQIFVLTNLDAVVDWAADRNSVALIGPWHPLVVAKRYMVQHTLSDRANALSRTEGEAHRQLATLLQGVSGFGWFATLSENDRLWEPMVVFPTDDPGWHLAVKRSMLEVGGPSDTIPPVVGLLATLKASLGLEVPSLGDCGADLVSLGLSSFLRAYPGRRAAGVLVGKGHSLEAAIASAHNLLHREENPTLVGHQLSGGVRLYFEQNVPDAIDVDVVEPPVLVFNTEGADPPHQADMQILDLTDGRSFRPAAQPELITLPRGRGCQTIFGEPVHWLTDGQSQLPISVRLSFDCDTGGEDLGGTFLTAATLLCGLPDARFAQLHLSALPQQLTTTWIIAPGARVDPGVFVRYAREASARLTQDWTLWDYRCDITQSRNSYYILSVVPQAFEVVVSGFFGRRLNISRLIEDLGSLGIAIGGEALKSGRHALGVVGLLGAARLLRGSDASPSAFLQDENSVGFIVPVDSFSSFFGSDEGTRRGMEHRRGDLLAVQLMVPVNPQGDLVIQICGVESKFVTGTYNQARAVEAMSQARASMKQLRELIEVAREDWAMPERLALLAIIQFGLRVTSANRSGQGWAGLQQKILTAVLRGRVTGRDGATGAIVVSTESGLHGAAEHTQLADGWWIRLNQMNWPDGENESQSLSEIRRRVSSLFPRTWLGRVGGSSTSDGDRDSGSVSVVEAGGAVGGPIERIVLGADDSRRLVYWEPQSSTDRLDNLNLMITGSSGSGKTQLLKYLLLMLRQQGKNVMVLDFKNDFADDAVFAEKANLERIFVSFDGLPFNPLIPYPLRHPGTGELVVQIAQHIAGLASVLQRTYGLGAQQQVAVKNAIVQAFSRQGLRATGSIPFDPNAQYPDFAVVGEILQETNINAYNRLDPLFTLDLFREETRNSSFHSLVNEAVILDLSSIPSDQIKNALAELIVLSAHSYYNSQPHSGTVRQMLVFDEAHRVMGSETMVRLVRECRAYGVGTVLSSQYTTDFPADISSSMATKVLHSNGRDADRIRAITQMIGAGGREEEAATLGRFEAFVDNRHYPATLVRMMNYPLYLLYSFLKEQGEIGREALREVPGIDESRLPLSNLLRQLEKLGLAWENDGVVRLIQ